MQIKILMKMTTVEYLLVVIIFNIEIEMTIFSKIESEFCITKPMISSTHLNAQRMDNITFSLTHSTCLHATDSD